MKINIYISDAEWVLTKESWSECRTIEENQECGVGEMIARSDVCQEKITKERKDPVLCGPRGLLMRSCFVVCKGIDKHSFLELVLKVCVILHLDWLEITPEQI